MGELRAVVVEGEAQGSRVVMLEEVEGVVEQEMMRRLLAGLVVVALEELKEQMLGVRVEGAAQILEVVVVVEQEEQLL